MGKIPLRYVVRDSLAFQPSKFLAPLVPSFVRSRWGGRIDDALSQADSILDGGSDKAIDQRSALFAFAIRVLSAAIAFFSQVVLARWMGSFQYGVFVWIWVAVVIIGSLSCFGYPSIVVRFIPKYRQSNDMNSLRGVILGSKLFAFCSASFFALIGISGIYLFGDSIQSVYVIPFYLAAICLPMLALTETMDGVSRAFSWITLGLSPTFILRPLLILALMFVAVQTRYLATAQTAMTATIIATWLTGAIQLFLLNKKLGATLPSGPRTFHFKMWLKVAAPVFLIEGFFALLTNVDIMIVGFFLDPSKVAVYFAAVKVLALVHFVYFAVKAASAHRISQYFHSGELEQYRAKIHEVTRWTFWPSLVFSGILLLLGPYLLYLFGEEFVEGYPLLFVLVIGLVARASVGPAETVLTMSGEQNSCAVIYGITLAVNIMLNLMLIPSFGLMGAAIGTTVALLYEAFALYSAARRRLGINIFVFGSTKETSD